MVGKRRGTPKPHTYFALIPVRVVKRLAKLNTAGRKVRRAKRAGR